MKITISLLGVLISSVLACAQQSPSVPTAPVVRQRSHIRSVAKRPAASKAPITIGPVMPASVPSNFYVGAAKVDVTKDETVVRLAMAQHGSVLIELPANDGPRYIIPGDPDMATVDQKALEHNKRAIVVRPGAEFWPPPRNRPARSPAATVTAQMRSGLVVTFLFYPVEDLSQNVHRCVLNYNRDEVVARRRSAGLPVNLDNNEEKGDKAAQNAAALSLVSVADNQLKMKAAVTSEPATASTIPPIETKNNTEHAGSSAFAPTTDPSNAVLSGNNSASTKEPSPAEAYSRAALAEAVKQPKRFKKWTRSLHGLSLSVATRNDHDQALSVTIIGVRNTTADTLKLVAGNPELFIETIDDKGRSINLQSIKKAHVEASGVPGTIAAGTTAYYAVAYVSPVLDAHQQLKISVAQTNAADEPALVTIAQH